MDIKRIVLGIDGSPAAAGAAQWAAEAVADSGGEVIAVHGLGSLPELLLGLPPSRMSDWKNELRRTLDRNWCRPLREAGVSYRCVLADTDPVHALLETARRVDADLIVVGTEGESRFFRRLFGSLSDQVIHHARRPIVAVPYAPATTLKKASPARRSIPGPDGPSSSHDGEKTRAEVVTPRPASANRLGPDAVSASSRPQHASGPFTHGGLWPSHQAAAATAGEP